MFRCRNGRATTRVAPTGVPILFQQQRARRLEAASLSPVIAEREGNEAIALRGVEQSGLFVSGEARSREFVVINIDCESSYCDFNSYL